MRRLLLFAGTLFLSLGLWAQNLPLCQEAPFKAGENIRMGVMFKWGAVNTEVALTTLSLETVPYKTDSLYHAVCSARTAPFFDVFYKIRENFQSWFTRDDYHPVEAVRDTYESGYTAKNHFIYDWDAGIIRADVSYNGNPSQQKQIPMTGASYDIVSLVYSLRNVDWGRVPNRQAFDVPFAIDDQVYPLTVTYYGPETLKVRKLGKMNALRFSCTVVAGVLFEGDQQQIGRAHV